MTDGTNGDRRLDSWKEIAAHLRRDVRTVRRWERELGLPVRRVPGGPGRSVFAYVAEIDAWLAASHADTSDTTETMDAAPARSSGMARLVAASAAALALIALGSWRVSQAAPRSLRLQPAQTSIVAMDEMGVERWRHSLATDRSYVFGTIDMSDPTRVMTTGARSAFAMISFSHRRSDDAPGSGALLELSASGALRRSFSFTDTVALDGKEYGPPWAMTSFAVTDSGGPRRIAIAAHHFVWNPGIVAVLDERLERLGTFHHNGWTEAVRWVGPDRLIVAGFSNERDGGFVALLDPIKPLRMYAFPRSELNRSLGAPFNRALVQIVGDRIFVRTIEVPAADPAVASDAIYELTPSLDLVRASYSDAYWVRYATAREEGKVKSTRATSASRDGPPAVEEWSPTAGWVKRPISRTTTASPASHP